MHDGRVESYENLSTCANVVLFIFFFSHVQANVANEDRQPES